MGMHQYFNDDYSGTVDEPTYAKLKEINGVLIEALEKLARLGNGTELGNSDGNIIAQAALNKIREA